MTTLRHQIPDEPARKPKAGQPEFELQCAVSDRIRQTVFPDVSWTAFPAGEKRDPATGARLKRMGVASGWPDYLFLVNGQLIGVELKTEADLIRGVGKGYLTPEQKAVRDAWERQGVKYIVCHGFDAAITVLTIHGVIRPDVSLQRARPAA